MEDKNVRKMFENGVSQAGKSSRVERVQYVMDFGKVYVQYDFCLN
ncbi:MAG: hypothetical protein O3A01_01575 [bacterium]|nr:hypothetical protein [bacterium]